MKLLIATGLYPPEAGGPATHTRMLEKYLPERGIEVHAVPFSPVRHLPPLIRHLAYATELWRVSGECDVILAQDTVSVGLPSALVALLRRKPLIVRVPGDWAWEQGRQRWYVTDSLDEFQSKHYKFVIEIIRAAQRFVVRRARKVIAPSEYLARVSRGWLPSNQDVLVVYNGVDIKENPKNPSGVPHPCIVTSARLVPWKGVGGLIEVVSGKTEWSLIVIGDGPERQELERIAHRASRPERIRFLGALSHDEALGWYEAADVFVLNSSYEGLSHVLLEAMRFGTPIIATAVEGNKELIQDNVSGRLVPPGDIRALADALDELLNDRVKSRRLGMAARERSESFSIDRTVDAFERIVRSVCAS